MLNTLNHTAPSPPSLKSIGEEIHDLVFFNLVTPSWITTSGIPKSPELRFLIAYIVWSNLNHFLVHQLAATNSIQAQSTHSSSPPTPKIYRTSSRIHTWNPNGGLRWSSFERSSVVDVWLNSKCDSAWGAFHHWFYTRESWTPPASYFSWLTPN